MLLIAQICYRVINRHSSTDWRAMSEPVFFVFAFHFTITRPLTKLSANWLMAHNAGSLAFSMVHLLNVILTIVITILIYKLLRRLTPTICNWLSGTNNKTIKSPQP